MMPWIMTGLGLAILLLAGDVLVRGAVNLSLRIGIPALIVSLTIVAFGTSAPELLIGISAIHEGKPGLALGNVVGSNTANVLLVLGLPAILSRMQTSRIDTKRSYYMMLLATVGFIGLAFLGPLTWVSGLILLAGLAVVLGDQVREARCHMA
ncbi:MAG: sodium:calcium antiporter, partial [Pseudomonadota bacterium]|nr:sodium:calcium antiporter [Pseudomonadota bacterium]